MAEYARTIRHSAARPRPAPRAGIAGIPRQNRPGLTALSRHRKGSLRHRSEARRRHLLEDGVPRPFTVFENAGAGPHSAPVGLTLLFDTSASVADAGLLNPLASKETLFDTLGNVRIAV